MKMYRYTFHNVASISDSDYPAVTSHFPQISFHLEEYEVSSETKKGYWINYGSFAGLHSKPQWISKTAKKAFARKTKAEALNDFILRTKKRIQILNYQIDSCSMAIDEAKKTLTKISKDGN